jgi:arginase family enzyme
VIDVRGLPAWGGLRALPPTEAAVIVAGIPYDGSAVYRSGAAQAPAALRRLSAVMPPVDERGRRLDSVTVHDAGDLDLGAAVESGWAEVAGRLTDLPSGAFLTVLGGDHCSAIPVLIAQARRHPGLALLWVDAHPDLCDFSRGGRWTVGCALRRALELAPPTTPSPASGEGMARPQSSLSGIEASSVVIAGCRDFDPEEVEYAGRHGILMIPAAEIAEEPAAALARIAEHVHGRRLHISFDIDVLDPAFAPGTEVPSAGGLSTRQALQVLEAAARVSRPVGLDVCEVAPPLDPGDLTCLAALKVIFETWAQATGTRWRPPTR